MKFRQNPLKGFIRYALQLNLPLFKIELTNLASFALKKTEVELLSVPGSNSFITNMSFQALEMNNIKHNKAEFQLSEKNKCMKYSKIPGSYHRTLVINFNSKSQ